MLGKALAVWFFLIGSSVAQTTTISIKDQNGNQAVGTVTAGNVFFHDNNGNTAVGTIRDGKVFLNTNKGETTFGTIKDGKVFLTDQKGLTTGTIKNGNIFLNNSDGSVTTGIYNKLGNVVTTTTPAPTDTTQQQQAEAQQQQENERLQQQIQQNYAAAYASGYAIGTGLGNVIAAAVERHKATAFCKANPAGTYKSGTIGAYATPCPSAPLDQSQKEQSVSYCADRPGEWMSFGRRWVHCDTPPDPANLKWAKWEMEQWAKNYKAQIASLSPEIYHSRDGWTAWRVNYCRVAKPLATYKTLDGKKERCN